MTIQISDEEFDLIEDRAYRAPILSVAVAKHLGSHNEAVLQKYGPKCGWIHFSIVKNYINRGSKIGRDFWKDVSSSDEEIFRSEEVRNFIHMYVEGIDVPKGSDGHFVVALHDKVVDLLTIASLSGHANDWMQSGLERFHKDMKAKEVLKLN